MSKHRGEVIDVVALGPEPAIAIIVDAKHAFLFERLLTFYARITTSGQGKDALQWRGYPLKPWQAGSLAHKIRRIRRGE